MKTKNENTNDNKIAKTQMQMLTQKIASTNEKTIDNENKKGNTNAN